MKGREDLFVTHEGFVVKNSYADKTTYFKAGPAPLF
jgi:hypothetical protein